MNRILTLTSWYPPHHFGGYEISCFDVMTRFLERGYDVRVLCSDECADVGDVAAIAHEDRVDRELRLYMRDSALYHPGVGRRMSIERHNHAVLARILDEHQPDVVSVWHMGAMSLGLLQQLHAHGVPIVYSVCDDWLTYGESLDAWSCPFAGSSLRRGLGHLVQSVTRLPVGPGDVGPGGTFCFISEYTRQRTIAHSDRRYDRTTVVYNGIDGRRFPPIDAVARREWRWILLYTGRFDQRKGIETAIRALTALPEQTKLVCDGRGSDEQRAQLESLAGELGVAERVELATSTRENLVRRYREADVFLFPSEWEEPFGLAPLEAMACGTPVVATRVGGSAEFLRDGYNCVSFPPRDAASLAGAVRRLADDPVLRDAVVLGGLRTAEELDVDHFADALEAWHQAAAEHYAHGVPPDRHLDLPPANRPVVEGTG